MKPDQKFFIFDVESVGLHGEGFAVAGGVYDVHGSAISEFAFHCPDIMADQSNNIGQAYVDRMWVSKNVTISPQSREFPTPAYVRTEFWSEWQRAKQQHPDILMFVECGWPVEANFLEACVADYPGDRNWDGPYPMHEIATYMLAAGMDPIAAYERKPEELPAHEPLADARLSARLLSTAILSLRGENLDDIPCRLLRIEELTETGEIRLKFEINPELK